MGTQISQFVVRIRAWNGWRGFRRLIGLRELRRQGVSTL